jgi:phosphatidylserine decarboxylase
MFAGPGDRRWAPPGDWQQITIFLSPMDVHINRTPVSGRVTRIEYRPGKFLPAYDEGSNDNELNEIWLDHDGQTVVVRQVVGILARRIVCRVTEGQELARGERIGLMKFGSRMDVFLPPAAVIRVGVGDRVVAGESVLAHLETDGAR